MDKRRKFYLTALLFGMGALLLPATSWAQDAGAKDPARWYTDLTTPQARYQNAKKEAAAAYQQALTECRGMRGADATSCRREAKKNFDSDTADARKLAEGR